MKNKALLCVLTVILLVAGACSSTPTNTNTNANSNSNAANKNTATTNTNSAAPSNANSTATAPAAAEGQQDFTLHNKTGVVIDKLFVSPSDKDDWQEDVLGQDTLADGQSVEIKFHPKEKAAKWDIKVVDSEDNSIEWHDLNLMEISEVTLHFENGKGTAEVK
jgi:hypothetical protein